MKIVNFNSANTQALAFKKSRPLFSSKIEGFLALLDEERGLYLWLDEVGKTIFELLDQPRNFDAIVDALKQIYATDPSLEKDTGEFLEQLREYDLIEFTAVENSRPDIFAIKETEKQDWQKPCIQRLDINKKTAADPGVADDAGDGTQGS